jgi:hypothetical protein
VSLTRQRIAPCYRLAHRPFGVHRGTVAQVSAGA